MQENDEKMGTKMTPDTLLDIFDQLRTDQNELGVAQWKHHVLDTIIAHVHADRANFISQHNQYPPVQLTRNTHIRNNIAYQEHYHALDPLGFMVKGETGLMLTHGPKSSKKIVSLDEVVDWASFKKSEYYNDFLRPLEIDHEIIVYLQSRDRVLGILSVMRNSSQAFDPKEIELLRLLEPYLTTCLQNFVIRREAKPAAPIIDRERIQSWFSLTKREAEVVEGIFKGRTNAQIAEAFFVSETTVKKHIQNICAKMGLKSRTAIIHTILKVFGLI